MPAAPPREAAPGDEALFACLRTWRTQAARARGVPAYVVFSDATLAAIAAARPRTAEALLAVRGVGPSKLDAFGDEVLAIVRGA